MTRLSTTEPCWTIDLVSTDLIRPLGHHTTEVSAEAEASDRAQEAYHAFEPETFHAFELAVVGQLDEPCDQYACDHCSATSHVGPDDLPAGWCTDGRGRHHCPDCPPLYDGPVPERYLDGTAVPHDHLSGATR